jgi:S-adenosylmethionine:tRNA ribosyltransferase-isomerase
VPASLRGHAVGVPVELRLLRMVDDVTWDAVVFGDGDWRTPTERRAAAPALDTGDVVSVDASLFLRVIHVDADHRRVVRVRADGAAADVWAALYRRGRPVQYAYVKDDLPLWAVQTTFAARPWAVELPSAGRPLSVPLLLALRARGVALATLTHAVGLSSTGNEQLDARLPFPERSDIPATTVAAIARARAAGSRVVAVGTTVVRALEGSAHDHGALRAGEHTTSFTLGAHTHLRVVDAILTGMHEPGTSHDRLLQAFAPRAALDRAFQLAVARGFLGHEFGDSAFIVAERGPAARARALTGVEAAA